jgi:hypothetical protein
VKSFASADRLIVNKFYFVLVSLRMSFIMPCAERVRQVHITYHSILCTVDGPIKYNQGLNRYVDVHPFCTHYCRWSPSIIPLLLCSYLHQRVGERERYYTEQRPRAFSKEDLLYRKCAIKPHPWHLVVSGNDKKLVSINK